MKKRMRIISLVLSCILIIGFVSLSYGADFEPVTGAAFGLQASAGVKAGTSEIKASATDPNGSSQYPYYVKPSSSNGTQYYYNGSSITNLGSIGATINSWGSMVGAITQSFAYSAKGIADAINQSSVFNWPSLNYTYSPSTTDNAANVNFSLGSSVGLQAINNQLTEMFRESWRFQYRMFKYFMPSVDQLNDNWNGPYYRRRVSFDGTLTQESRSNSSIMVEFANFMYDFLVTESNLARRIFGSTVDSDNSSAAWNKMFAINTGNEITNPSTSLWSDIRYLVRYITHIDTNTLRLPSSGTFTIYDSSHTALNVSPTSIYDWLRRLGNNLSDNVSRLAFVLANDEDIALRQQTEDQQTAYKTNFTVSGAAGRMSGSDIADTAAAGSEIKSAFTSSASGRDAFNGFSADTDGRWDWFSIEILNSLDTTTNNRKSNDDLTNFLGDYYNEVIRYVD